MKPDAVHVISIEGFICPPEADVVFNRWHDEKYIPANMKFKGILSLTRSKLIRGTAGGTVSEYPLYLNTFRFKNMAGFKQWNSSPELAEALKNWRKVCVKRGVKMPWRAQYESMRTWNDTPAHFVTLIVGTIFPPEGEAKFDAWYSDKHIPDLMGNYAGMVGAVRYKLAGSSPLGVKRSVDFAPGEYPIFLTYYYFQDVPAAEGYDASVQAAPAIIEDWLNICREASVVRIWRAQYMPMRTWQK